MRKDFLDFAKEGFVLLDGGFGTELQKRGLPGGVPPENLNLDAPDTVLEVHRAYAESGADVISANTFGANRRKHPEGGEAAALTAAGVKLARRAAGDGKYVALDIGPPARLRSRSETCLSTRRTTFSRSRLLRERARTSY